jgi:hypothetical protein
MSNPRPTNKYLGSTFTAEAQDFGQQLMAQSCIPVSAAYFQFSVRSLIDNTPHHAFFDDPKDSGLHKAKRAAMWLTPMGLLCEQKGKYKMVPAANLLDVNFK